MQLTWEHPRMAVQVFSRPSQITGSLGSKAQESLCVVSSRRPDAPALHMTLWGFYFTCYDNSILSPFFLSHPRHTHTQTQTHTQIYTRKTLQELTDLTSHFLPPRDF